MPDPLYIPSVHDAAREYKIVYVQGKSPLYTRLLSLLRGVPFHGADHADRPSEVDWYTHLRLTRGWRLCTHHDIFGSHQLTFCRPRSVSPP